MAAPAQMTDRFPTERGEKRQVQELLLLVALHRQSQHKAATDGIRLGTT